jgi:preprotein translocase subunit SecA
MAERGYDEVNRTIGRQIYRQAAREDVTLEALASSADPAQRLVYRRAIERMEETPDEETATQPIRRLPDEVKAPIEAAFVDAYRLFRDRQLMLRAVDSLWVRHLTDLDALREGIGLRAYGQQNPLVAYRKEAHDMYEALLARIQETVARSVYLVPQALIGQPRQRPLRATRARVPGGEQRAQQARPAQKPSGQSLGRNDPCWCGSGKKYKQCHMRQDLEDGRPSEVQRAPTAGGRPPQAIGRRRRRRG